MKGQLKLIEGKILEYGIYTGGSFENLSQYLNTCLLNKVKIELKFNNEVHSFEGKLELRPFSTLKKDKNTKTYKYYIDETCELDDLLWGLIDKNIEITMKNITGEDIKEDIK